MGAPLLASPFRPFFLATAIYAAATIFAWIGHLFTGWPIPLGENPVRWHAHEMLFGFLPAAITGFLLTAMTNWTGALPLRDRGLLALVMLWLAGRVAMWCAGWWPAWSVAAIDIAYLPVLALYAGGVLLRYGNRRNLFLVGVLGLFALANVLFHLQSLDVVESTVLGERMAMNLITLLMVVIAGRITPAFTGNWLSMHGLDPTVVQTVPALDRAAIAATALMIPIDFAVGPVLTGSLMALLACALNGARLVLWGGWHIRHEPLLWILHLGYAWIVLALLLKGLQPFTAGIPPTAWLHAIGAGAAGTLIMGVMTRVSLGHTGRCLALPRFGVTMYVAVLAAGTLRVAAAIGAIDYRAGLTASAVAWIAAFALFAAVYWPILSRPRADGRPG
ncbi:NnrS family protein [Spectribacter hydrogenoxidans]|uniref:NnrS family protein n=1 Tax=Spectribacter hydrogenoxidans TaxID=3075608 RepID=A0ABU3BYG5_9GAMM|nr:NnrS family protein [Salinisphaera sp. W335]MDT0634333.1 NnrS family protein [Salinisphaera sp. W335]